MTDALPVRLRLRRALCAGLLCAALPAFAQSARYEIDTAASYDRPLLRVFAPHDERPRGRQASSLLREMRPQMRRLLVRRARMHPYLVNHVMRMATQRARILGLRVRGAQRAAQREALVLHERIMMQMLLRDRENYAL